MRVMLKWLGRTLLVLMLLAVLAVGGMMTSAGQRLLVAAVQSVSNSEGRRIEIGVLDGSLLSSGRIDRIAVSDRDGVWLEVRQAEFSWSPLALFSGRIDIGRLAIGAIEVSRRPFASQATGADRSDADLPMMALDVERIEVSEIVLSAPVLGTPARLRLAGSANIVDRSRGLSASLDITRTDGAGGQASARLSYRPDGRQLEVAVAASEPAGGLMARLLELQGLPPLDFEANGRGPLDQWRAHWSLAAAGEPFIAGNAGIDTADDGSGTYRLRAGFEGYLSPVLPPVLKAVFDGKTVGALDGYWYGNGRFEAETVSLESGAFAVSAKGGVDPGTSHVHGTADIRVARSDGQPVEFALSDGRVFVLDGLESRVVVPDAMGLRRVTTDLSVSGLETPWGRIGKAEFQAAGEQARPFGKTALRLDKTVVSLALREIAPLDEALRDLLGPSVDVRLTGAGSPASATVDTLHLQSPAVQLSGSGGWKDGIATLAADIEAADLGKLSSMAGRSLVGRSSLHVRASLPFDQPAPVAVVVQGTATDAGFGDRGSGSVLTGETRFSGKVLWASPRRLTVEAAQVSHPLLQLEADAEVRPDSIEAHVEGRLTGLSLASASLSGALSFSGTIEGTSSDLQSHVSAAGADVTFNGKPVAGLKATLIGSGPSTEHRGRFAIEAEIGGKRLSGSLMAAFSDQGAIALEDLSAMFATARLTGSVQKRHDGPVSGELRLAVPDLGDFAELTGAAASGSLSADLQLGGTRQRPTMQFNASAERAQISGIEIVGFEAGGSLGNYLDAIQGNAEVRLRKAAGDGFLAEGLQAAFTEADRGLGFKASGVVNESKAAMTGTLVQSGSDYLIELADLRLDKAGTSVRLDAPGTVAISNGAVDVGKLSVSSSGGRAVLEGTAGRNTMDLKITLSNFPASFANAYRSDLGLGGTLHGSVVAKGAIDRPSATVSLDWRDATSAATREAQVPPVAVSLKGRLRSGEFDNHLTIRGSNGLSVIAQGRGTASQLHAIEQRVTGAVPLTLANAATAARGTRFGGTAKLDSTLSGTVEQPRMSGTVAISGATVADPESGLKLHGVNGLIRLTGTSAVIERLQGRSDKGGTVAIGGALSGLTSGQPQTDITVRLAAVKFDDDELMSGEIDGDLAVAGPVTDVKASGSIYIRRLDVRVPNQLPRSVAVLDLRHVNAPPHLQKSDLPASRTVSSKARSGGIGLEISIEAADRIFVAGRGLDAQLGGHLDIRGRSGNPAAIGTFDLVRGRLSILGRQLDFKRGQISFNGSLDPYIELAASAPADGVTASVDVYGPLSQLAFRFSSVPDLPEDEVVAKLLFNKSLANLSPLQIAQLAGEIDKIGGLSSGPGILDRLKSSVGVDVLDIGTDKSGGTTVSAGSYLNDQTYVGVQQGTAASSSRVIIDHDLTKTLKARGEVGADGNSKIGIGVEWDY